MDLPSLEMPFRKHIQVTKNIKLDQHTPNPLTPPQSPVMSIIERLLLDLREMIYSELDYPVAGKLWKQDWYVTGIDDIGSHIEELEIHAKNRIVRVLALGRYNHYP
jgi:hypothetical protein